MSQPYRMRVVPWWTDGCARFVTGVFKWWPRVLGRALKVLEYGAGNSTLYLLARGARVVSIEHDAGYRGFVRGAAEQAGYKVVETPPEGFAPTMLDAYDLVLIAATGFAETERILCVGSWDVVINDGIGRREVLEIIREKAIGALIILDNVEYCANWGRLDRTSAKPDLMRVYRAMLRDAAWRHYIFEQPEGREGHGQADAAGWESPHRWASAVLWPQGHDFARLMVTQIGWPLVNPQGADDADLEDIGVRCPFDWESMRWLKDPFPPELDLKLARDFD
ncbi:MAG: hypothetical protein H6865_06355 [Rhodospirillales bacterium]|nr:hypothetical protein [Alphaproteobacteria bacterium]MCB9987243.1 hypothetical protein [Rhodospirillales bacterium]USO07896.1 MAG: hypothetical protein H6866_01345 [Rhodospirillales bacterium]